MVQVGNIRSVQSLNIFLNTQLFTFLGKMLLNIVILRAKGHSFSPSNDFRLLTEAEWEFAAGAGNKNFTLYCWGNEEPDSSMVLNTLTHSVPVYPLNHWQGKFPETNTKVDGFLGTAPSKSFPTNVFGLHNMCGNVWEWTSDWFSSVPIQNEPGNILHNPKGPSFSIRNQKVQKGGSFLCHRDVCYRYRISARMGNTPNSSSSNIGFRCGKSTGELKLEL